MKNSLKKAYELRNRGFTTGGNGGDELNDFQKTPQDGLFYREKIVKTHGKSEKAP